MNLRNKLISIFVLSKLYKMKIILTLFLAATVSICNAQNVILYGKITNPKSDSIIISGENLKKSIVIYLSKDGSFTDTMNLDRDYYRISHGDEFTDAFLKPGDNLYFTLDTKMFDESVKYKGVGENENNYLAQKVLLSEKLELLDNMTVIGGYDEKKFLESVDSAAALKNELLKGFVLEKEFAAAEKKDIEFTQLDNIASYEMYHGYIKHNEDFKVSESYPDAFKNFNFNDDSSVKNELYLKLLSDFFSKQAYKQIREDSTRNFLMEFSNAVLERVQSTIVRNGLGRLIVEDGLKSGNDLKVSYAAIKKLISDKDVQASLDEKFAMLSKLQKGNTSPDFSLQDIKGKTFSLSDFKGKVVYIDVWATWCGPCKAEMPFMKKIQEDLKGKDVAFIGICAWDKQENWKKYIEENKMQGTQLFAPDRALPFLKEYDIKGIPRFILLDKEGKIVEADAARPSDPQLKAKIESLL